MTEALMVVAIGLCSLGLVYWAAHRNEVEPNCPICGSIHTREARPGWECRQCEAVFSFPPEEGST